MSVWMKNILITQKFTNNEHSTHHRWQSVWYPCLSNNFHISNTLTHFFTHFFTHTYLKRLQKNYKNLISNYSTKHPYTFPLFITLSITKFLYLAYMENIKYQRNRALKLFPPSSSSFNSSSDSSATLSSHFDNNANNKYNASSRNNFMVIHFLVAVVLSIKLLGETTRVLFIK